MHTTFQKTKLLRVAFIIVIYRKSYCMRHKGRLIQLCYPQMIVKRLNPPSSDSIERQYRKTIRCKTLHFYPQYFCYNNPTKVPFIAGTKQALTRINLLEKRKTNFNCPQVELYCKHNSPCCFNCANAIVFLPYKSSLFYRRFCSKVSPLLII